MISAYSRTMTSKAKSDTNIKVLKGPDGKQYNHTMDPFADSFVLKAENKVLDYIKRVRTVSFGRIHTASAT